MGTTAPGASAPDVDRQGGPHGVVRILLVDDHAVFRAGLRALLERQPGVVIVGEAGTGDDAVALAEATHPQVVLMDVAMPGAGGLEATRRIVDLGIGAKVLVLTALVEEDHLLDALEAGASGYVEKSDPVDGLLRAIRAVRGNHLFLCADAARLVVLQRYRKGEQVADERAAAGRLSAREREVLSLLAQGWTSREISRRLGVPMKTVEGDRACIRDRLGLRRRPDLVRFALRTGLLGDR